MARRDKKREDLMLGVKLGLFERRHRRKIGPAVWLYMPLQALTQLNGGDGHVEFSQPEIIHIAQEEWGFSERTAYRYFRRLVEEEYLRPREDGTWEITKYENFKMFLERKKGLAKSGKAPVKTGRNCARSGKKFDKTGKDSGSESDLRVIRDIREIGEGESAPNSQKERHPDHQRLMALYREAIREDEGAKRGKELSAPGKENKAAQKILQMGFTAEEAMDCYHHFKAESFWRGKHLSLAYLVEHIGAWKESKGEADRRMPGKPGVSRAQRDYYAAHLDPKD